MKKLIKEMRTGEEMYTWVEYFDGGERSKYAYSTLEEAMEAAAEHVRHGIRLTKRELKKMTKENVNFVDVCLITINEDGDEEEGFAEACVVIDESTLDCLY